MRDAEIRSVCKDRIESLEHWLRRLIDDTLVPVYGDYFGFVDDKGNRLISGRLSQLVEDRQKKEPTRYPRKIDAVLLEDAVTIICKPDLFKSHFRKALANAFPEGLEEARTFLSRLLVPRNNLAHANAISIRQAEQIICYSNDVIESLKKYYSELGMQQEYNVPLILKVTDSFGNVFMCSQFRHHFDHALIDLAKHSEFFLHPTDILTLEVEIDPSFHPDTYTVTWACIKGLPELTNSGPKVVIPITNSHVGELLPIHCQVTSKKDWHRMSTGLDDLLKISYKVLPPIE